MPRASAKQPRPPVDPKIAYLPNPTARVVVVVERRRRPTEPRKKPPLKEKDLSPPRQVYPTPTLTAYGSCQKPFSPTTMRARLSAFGKSWDSQFGATIVKVAPGQIASVSPEAPSSFGPCVPPPRGASVPLLSSEPDPVSKSESECLPRALAAIGSVVLDRYGFVADRSIEASAPTTVFLVLRG